MAKKKQSRKSSSRKPGTTASKPKKANVAEKKMSKAEQFRLEYAYVIQDLRTVFILAGIMFALLIALNLFLQ